MNDLLLNWWNFVVLVIGLIATLWCKNRYNDTKSKPLLTCLPGVWTSLGLLGTFCAICLSLHGLDANYEIVDNTGKTLAEVKAANSQDLDIMKIISELIPAFTTSIIGLIGALLVTLWTKVKFAKEEVEENSDDQKLNENDFEKNEMNIEFSRTYLGDIFHAAINVFHETKKLSEVRDFLRDQILDDRSLEKIFSLISEIVDQFNFLFTNASYSEIPFCLKYFEDGKKKFRNGRIDLLVEKGNEILIVDYKFYEKSLIDDDIREQLRFYKNAMSKIYNGKVIKCFVLWVEDVSLVEVNI